ncbi:major facilitator superfamily domain-containing protein [Microdochium trichocladiopsis]|uniref:Major facilitator superfamily domain-containing protein n=1 Tax=Microdochium trichocladiopsis TaxID=1682393 RepID=A0A9P8YIE1_9PEZI|nr:major facilitator superfamily domain-containing protein [Microdochium trichocladiopsis]KAH7040567.1 major facilitator superfamily domain-containing protein [Microdochium trichocladiopsis]
MGGVGSVIVATAPSFTVAILGHCVMGCGLANQPLLFTIIAEILPRRWRSFGHASLMVTSCLGSTVGLLVVGGIPPQDHFGAWRTYYFVNLGCHAVGVLFAVLAYRSPSPDMPEVVQRRELTRMDWPGYTILFFALSAFSASFFISHAPTSAEQDSAIPGFLVGLLMVIALLIYELVGRKDGFLNHNLFLHRNFALATLSLFGAGVSFAAFEWCFLTQTVNLYDADPFLSGVRSIVTLVSAMIAAPLAAWYCCAKRKIRGASVVGFAACLAFYIAMAHTDQTTNIQTWIYPTFLGAAMGILMVTLPTSAQLSIPSQLLSMGTALLICGFILGRSIGFIIYDHLVQSAMVEGYPAIVHRLLYSGSPKEFADEVITYLKSNQAGPLPDVPGLTDAILDDGMAALKACYVAAFKKAWIAAGCFAGVSMLTASPMDNPEEQFTMKIDVPLESTAEVEPKP